MAEPDLTESQMGLNRRVMKDNRTAANLRKDPEKHAAYLDRKRRERKRAQETRNYETERKRRWRLSNPEDAQRIRKANHAVERALLAGRLVKPGSCEMCGHDKPLEDHHERYEPEFWLVVKWLCDGCHAIADGRAA